MSPEPDVSLLTHAVLAGTFLLSAVFGAIVHRTGFCTMGAVTDVVTMGEWTRMRQWALAAGVAVLGFALLAAGGVIRSADTVYAAVDRGPETDASREMEEGELEAEFAQGMQALVAGALAMLELPSSQKAQRRTR